MRNTLFAMAGGLALIWTGSAAAQTEIATGPFTAAQVEQGRKIYFTRCAGCHLPNMAGKDDALALAGYQFMAGWRNLTTQNLYRIIQSSMPKDAPGSLDEQAAANVTAYILHANGAKPGPTAFLQAPPLRIDMIANGIAPADLGVPPAQP